MDLFVEREESPLLVGNGGLAQRSLLQGGRMTLSPKFLWMLDHARKEQMCMDPFCGTCGATPFMKWVERNLGLEEFVPWQTFFRRQQCRDLLIDQLASLDADQAERNFEAVKFFLTRAFFSNSPAACTEITHKLINTPAGQILARMKRHHEDRMAKRALSDPEVAKVRREEKKKKIAEAHQRRVEFYRANPFISRACSQTLRSDQNS